MFNNIAKEIDLPQDQCSPKKTTLETTLPHKLTPP